MSLDRIQLNQENILAAIGEAWSREQIAEALELLALADGRFPPGCRSMPPELVRAVQRERMIAAMLSAASALGYRKTNVQDVLDRAGVSRPTFYEHFSNKEDCCLAAFDASSERLRGKINGAARAGGGIWRERVRLALESLLEFAVHEPETARFLVVEARAGSAAVVSRRVELMDGFATCLDAQAKEFLPNVSGQTSIAAAGIVGGIESLLYSRLCKRQHAELETLLPSLMYFVVLPYEGHEAAGEELPVG
jgi:AcrR family transcriptional regulator